MNKNRLLLTLVVANVLLAFASVGAEAFFGWTLPPALADYKHARYAGFPIMGVGGALQFLLVGANALCAFGAWIGLLFYWRYARQLFLISLALTLAHLLLAGPSVRTSVGAMFGLMDSTVGGVIIGLVYFSDLARRFEGATLEGAASAGVSVGAHRA